MKWKQKQILSVLLCIAMMFTLFPVTALAAADYNYIDGNGTLQTVNATVIDSSTTTLTTGWYIVNSTVSMGTLTISGAVNLILKDGVTLTTTGSAGNPGVNVIGSNSLTIYGQTGGTGILDATGGNDAAGIGSGLFTVGHATTSGNINIYGGTIIATSTGAYGGAGIGSGKDNDSGTVNIYGGTVTATAVDTSGGAGIGGGYLSPGGNVNIYGGMVTANGGNAGSGIGGGYMNNGGNVKIYGGTVTATGGSNGTGIGGGYNGSGGTCVIAGGSVKPSSMGCAPTNGNSNGSARVYCTTVKVKDISAVTKVTALTTSTGYYGTQDLYTNAAGNLYLWLPDSAVVTAATIAGGSYVGTVTAATSGTASGNLTLNLAPTDITLSKDTVAENTAAGSICGTLSTTDANSGDTFTYSLVSGTGSTDNSVFAVTNGELKLMVMADYEAQSSYSIRIKSTDAGGLSYEKVFTITVLPQATVQTVSVPADGSYKAGDYLDFTVNFDNVVTVDTTGGTPCIPLTIGSTTKNAIYQSGSGTKNLIFRYTVVSGDNDSDGVTLASAIVLNSGTIQNQSNSTNTELTLNSVPGTSQILVDTASPSITSVVPADSAVNVPINGSITLDFDKAMSPGAGTITLTKDGSTPILLDAARGNWTNNRNYRISYSNLSYATDYTVTISGFVDIAGNEIVPDSNHKFTTQEEPLIPSVTPDNLTIYKNDTENINIAFGQGTAAASGAAITVSNSNIASVSAVQVATAGDITVTGAAVGTTDITIAFDDTAHTVATVAITVQPKLPTWGADSTLAASGITSEGVTLTWPAAQDATAVTGYRIYQDGTLLATVNGSQTSYEVKGLSASTAYGFQVQAGNADDSWSTSGPGIHISTNRAITVQPKLPTWGADSTLAASGITSEGVTLTWPAAQDATAVTGYRIYQDGTLLATVNGSQTSYEVKGLSASTAYGFQVQAGNADDSWSTSGPDIHITTNGVSSNNSASDNTSSSNSSADNTSSNNGSTETKQDSVQTDSKTDDLILIGFDVKPLTDKKGNATVTLSDTDITNAIAKAREEATSQGRTEARIGVTVNIKLPNAAGSLKVTVSQQALKDLMDANVEQFTINGKLLSISYNTEALKELINKSEGEVTFSINRATGLSKKAKKLIGTRPAYRVTLSYRKKGKIQKITSMSGGSITLNIPYKIRKNEFAAKLYAIDLDKTGKLLGISGSNYDVTSRCVRFEIKRLSTYGIGYKNPGNR